MGQHSYYTTHDGFDDTDEQLMSNFQKWKRPEDLNNLLAFPTWLLA